VQAARDERKRLRRCPVKPLRVVDDTHHWALFGRLAQQAQHRQADEEAIRRISRTQAERDRKRNALRIRQTPQAVPHPRAELMQPRERKLHFRLHTRCADHSTPRRPTHQVLQQGRLADAWLAAQHQHPAFARPHRHE
jgi:hypothetical protein